jgi:type 1 glutamine amidotransferase
MKLNSLHVLLLSALAAFSFVSPAQAAEPKKLLVVTITTGFRHGPAIDAAEKIMPDLAAKSNGEFTFEFLSQPGKRPEVGKAPERDGKMTDAEFVAVEAPYKEMQAKVKVEDAAWNAKVKEMFAAKFSPASLATYDGVIFCNTTGELPLPDGDGFRNWVNSGKAFIGMHAATDTLSKMPAYAEMINGSFNGHPWGGGGTHGFINHEPAHPVVAMFPAEFEWKDEIYQYRNFNPEAVRVLLSLHMTRSLPRMPYHVPVSWVREVGTGRLFYTNLGHNASTWEHETYQKHIVTGIRWTLKLIDGPAQPNLATSSQETLKSIAAAAAATLKKDAAALEAKALTKAKADPKWAVALAAEADTYRGLPNPDPKKEPADKVEKAAVAKQALLEKLVGEIER